MHGLSRDAFQKRHPVNVVGNYWRRLSFHLDGRGREDNECVEVVVDLDPQITLADATKKLITSREISFI